MKVDSAVAEGKANEAFSMLNDEDLDYDRLKSFTSHQLEYGQCLSLGDVIGAMRTLFKSKGIIKMWAIEQFLRKLVAHYFRVLGVELRNGLVWKDPGRLEVGNLGRSRGRGLLDNAAPRVEDGTLSTDPVYMANQLEAEDSIYGRSRRIGLIVETVPIVPENHDRGLSSVTVLYDTCLLYTSPSPRDS